VNPTAENMLAFGNLTWFDYPFSNFLFYKPCYSRIHFTNTSISGTLLHLDLLMTDHRSGLQHLTGAGASKLCPVTSRSKSRQDDARFHQLWGLSLPPTDVAA